MNILTFGIAIVGGLWRSGCSAAYYSGSAAYSRCLPAGSAWGSSTARARSTSFSSGTFIAGHYHPSVVAESLPSFIREILGAATREDWQAVADKLIAEAREVNGKV